METRNVPLKRVSIIVEVGTRSKPDEKLKAIQRLTKRFEQVFEVAMTDRETGVIYDRRLLRKNPFPSSTRYAGPGQQPELLVQGFHPNHPETDRLIAKICHAIDEIPGLRVVSVRHDSETQLGLYPNVFERQ